jgi:hypothetical protein
MNAVNVTLTLTKHQAKGWSAYCTQLASYSCCEEGKDLGKKKSTMVRFELTTSSFVGSRAIQLRHTAVYGMYIFYFAVKNDFM